MESLVMLAYAVAILLWIPLGIIAASYPSLRGRVMVPLAASAIGAAFTVVMGLKPGTLIVVLAGAFLVDTIAGLVLTFATPRQPAERLPLRIAAIFCLVVPVLAIVAFAWTGKQTEDLTRNFDLQRRLHFEASFRDDETQKRFYGELKPDKNPWAGYYSYAGKGDDRFAHLVVSDDGRFWIYHSNFYDYPGHRVEGAGDEFQGAGDGTVNSRMRIRLRPEENGRVLMDVDYGAVPANLTTAPMVKAHPPRYPRAPSPRDEVRFAGVFSGRHDEKDNRFWMAQLWLWESGGEYWGRYIHGHYTRGATQAFIWTKKIDDAVKVRRVSGDEFAVKLKGRPEEVLVKRGEALPGFYLDLAPVATKKENREWLDAIGAGPPVTWTVP